MSLTVIFIIIFTHWVADFLFQDEKWALGKSKNWESLLDHTITYSLIWLFIGLVTSVFVDDPIRFILNTWYFTTITFICHTITDYFTSRIVSKKFANKQYGSSIPNFGAFTIIGIDQVLHYVQLFLTYEFLKQ